MPVNVPAKSPDKKQLIEFSTELFVEYLFTKFR